MHKEYGFFRIIFAHPRPIIDLGIIVCFFPRFTMIINGHYFKALDRIKLALDPNQDVRVLEEAITPSVDEGSFRIILR